MDTVPGSRRQFRRLSTLFLNRFVENDALCADGDTRATLIGVLALFVAPGVFLSFLEYLQFSSYPLGFYGWMVREGAGLPHKALHVALSMTVLGLATLLEWDAILPDRRDVAVLRPMPISLGVMFAARVFALLQFWLLLTIAIDAAPTAIYSMAIVQNAPGGVLLRYFVAHATTLVLANLFLFLSMLAVQGLLIAFVGHARFSRVAPYVQFALFVALLVTFFFSIGLAWGVNPDMQPSPMLDALPVFWFLGLDQQMLGWHKPFYEHTASHALPAIAIAAMLAALGYVLSYRAAISSSFEVHACSFRPPGRFSKWLAASVNRVVVRNPSERAAFYFVWHTVLRSRTHRFLIAAWSGFGLALVLQYIVGAIASSRSRWWESIDGPLLPVGTVLPLFTITGLRFACTVPSELRANWIFHMGCGSPEGYLVGARKAAMLLCLAPLFGLMLPAFIVAWGWTSAALYTGFSAGCAALLLQAQMLTLDKIPFTCSYVAGKGNVKSWWTFYVIGYLVYVGTLSLVASWMLHVPSRAILVAIGMIATGVASAWYSRRRRQDSGFRLLFDERPEPAVRVLGLAE